MGQMTTRTQYNKVISLTGSGSAFLLDSLSATAYTAYSSRKLRSAYSGSAFKVTTSVAGNAQLDIGFDGSGNFDTATLNGFITGVDSGTTNTIYNQAVGGGLPITTSSLATEPEIRLPGGIVTINSHVAMDWNSGGGAKTAVWQPGTIPQPLTFAACIKQTLTPTDHLHDGIGAHRVLAGFSDPNFQIYAGGTPFTGGTINFTDVRSCFWIFNGANSNVWVDGVNVIVNQNPGTADFDSSSQQVYSSASGFKGYICEMMWFASVLSAGDMALIRANWQSYWGAA